MRREVSPSESGEDAHRIEQHRKLLARGCPTGSRNIEQEHTASVKEIEEKVQDQICRGNISKQRMILNGEKVIDSFVDFSSC
jgi:hypothetical protein